MVSFERRIRILVKRRIIILVKCRNWLDAHRQVVLIEGTATVEATITKNTGSNPVLTTLGCNTVSRHPGTKVSIVGTTIGVTVNK